MYVRRCISTGKLIPHYVISARSAKFKSRLPARLDRFWRLVLVRGVFSFTNLRLGIENSASKMKPECPFLKYNKIQKYNPPVLVDCAVIVDKDMVASVTPVGRLCRGPCHTLTIRPLVMNDGLVGFQAPASALFHAQSHAHILSRSAILIIVVSQVQFYLCLVAPVPST